MHPILIAGAAVIGLPILLHVLFRQQPKKLLFPALRFLRQRQKTSQRRVQLRHVLLLLLRCLLLGLFALALLQPTLSTGGLANPFGDEPVAAVIVIDTSPSMGYRTTVSRLDEARRQANELLNELPPNSKVAVLTSHDPTGTWQPTLVEARQRIESLKEPTGSTQPLGPALRAAYDLFATADADTPDREPLVKLLAVFADHTASSWDPRDDAGLKAKLGSLPVPPAQVYFDVGVAGPVNLAITEVKMESDRLAGSADAVVTALVRSDGQERKGLAVQAQLDDGPTERLFLDLAAGETKPALFTFRRPAVGFHTVTVKIDSNDALPFDNERSFTFEVMPMRRVLAIADRPDDVRFWVNAHSVRQEFDCAVATSNAVPDLAPFEMVAVIAVADPKPFADKLLAYAQKGGKVFLAPDGPGADADDKRPQTYDALGELMPAALGEVKSFPRPGRPWKLDDERDLRAEVFAPIRPWQGQGVDLFINKRKTLRYRELKATGNRTLVAARYDAEGEPPALVEKPFDRGHVMLLTTRLDDEAGDLREFWNDFWVREGSWPVVFPWLVTKYLCDLGTAPVGEAVDRRRYNFPTGAEVPVSVRGYATESPRAVRLEGPGVAAGRSKFTAPADATSLTLRNKPPADAPRGPTGPEVWELEGEPLFTPGAFALVPDGVASPWRARFSLAVPAAESDLQPLPAETVAGLFGPGSVVQLSGKLTLADYVRTRQNGRIELFIPLILLVLIVFACEGILANRFYKLR
ncbi:MAG: BatA domain-containing protein [Fimbriiglobus sp.]|nr:BatA domain-containing protein [Fimbriiglobus sp.]